MIVPAKFINSCEEPAKMQSEQHQSTNDGPTVIRLPEVMCVIGLSRATIYRMVESGDFPQQFKLGRKAVGWLRTEVYAWIHSRAEERPTRPLTLESIAA